MGDKEGSLKRRIITLMMTGLIFMLVCFGGVAYYIVKNNIEHSLQHRLLLARLIKNNIDSIISDNLKRLYDVSLSGNIDLMDGNVLPEKKALMMAYQYSMFRDGVLLLDKNGNVLLTYPEKMDYASLNLASIEPVNRMIQLGRPVVSNIYTHELSGKKVIFALVPLRDRNGNHAGIIAGEMNPADPFLMLVLKQIKYKKDIHVDLVDMNGMVISSSDEERILGNCNRENFFHKMISQKKEGIYKCHECHFRDKKITNIIAMVPLETAPWAVVIQEPEGVVFSSVNELKKTFFVLGIIFSGIFLLITIGISQSIVNPIQELIKATDRISRGDLSKSISPSGRDELGILSASFERMRLRLLEYMERIKNYSVELEEKVRERTMALAESKKQIGNLLKKVITSQEEERKRIARELHDETLQDLSALLMRVDICRMNRMISEEKIEEIRNIILKILDGIYTIVQDLRPSVLDDLGLESAINWLLVTHLGERGINYYLSINGQHERRFPPEVETIIFRIVQEAILNIAKHSKAENAFVNLRICEDLVCVDIEDDGEGFEPQEVFKETLTYSKNGRGLGLIGMKERAKLIGGSLDICSSPGNGTRISLRLPLNLKLEGNV